MVLTEINRLRLLFVCFFSEEIIHDYVEASARICKIAVQCKYIFSSLKVTVVLLFKCSVTQTKLL